ncbi:hypothetical protein Bca52824_020910 [Brassica carinata]|uniref:Uncharacterized protein n=1 Tax=Brassica carinata TaxID=52824 RepID=A0A8X7VVV9_BRACI|nr:hypothetical protein Bca52824_020910 [Brassica carinata]
MATLQPFLEKITAKLNSWTVKTLSFAGKVTLVSSGVYGMVNFWSSVFTLPKRFYEKVDSLCSGFLWKNSTRSASGARVSWASICKPKKEGGLGIRRLEEFQKSYWIISDSQRFSPTVRSMIRIRAEAAEFLRCSIGDGRTARFWHDFWTDLGPLIEAFGRRGPRDLRIALDAPVSAAVSEGEWRLPPARSEVAETLQVVLTTMEPPTLQRGNDVRTNLPNPSSLLSVADLLALPQVVSSTGLPVVLKLLLQSIVYCLWRERNSRIFAGSSISEAGVVAQVDRLLRDRLISLPSLSSSHRSLLQVYFALNHPP